MKARILETLSGGRFIPRDRPLITSEAATNLATDEPAETISIPGNSFVEFIDLHREQFDRFSQSHEDLLNFQRTWGQATIINNLAQERIALDIASLGRGRKMSPKRVGSLEALYTTALIMLFSSPTEPEDGRQVNAQFQLSTNAISNIPSRLRHEGEEWLRKANAFGESYHEARNPFAQDYDVHCQALFVALKDHITSDVPRHFIDLSSFLTSGDFQQEREARAPFFVTLADRIGRARRSQEKSVLDDAWDAYKSYIEWEKEHPTQERFVEFLKITPIENDEFAWIQVLTVAMGKKDLHEEVVLEDENLAAIFRLFAESNTWPKYVKNRYEMDLLLEGGVYKRRIETALEEFGRRKDMLPGISAADFIVDRKEGLVLDAVEPGELSQAELSAQEERKKAPYKVALRRQLFENGPYIAIELREGELEEHIIDRANKLAKNDPRMRDDIAAMIESIRNRPTGAGTKVLQSQSMKILDQELPLHRLDPRKRRRFGLNPTHPLTRQLRVIYAIYGADSQTPRIILEGVYRHDDYDKKLDRPA